MDERQWPKVYDFCHTFMHVEQVKKHIAMREMHAKKTDTSSHCLVDEGLYQLSAATVLTSILVFPTDLKRV